MGQIEQVLTLRAEKLINYSAYNFLKQINRDLQYQVLIENEILQFDKKTDRQIIEINIDTYIHYFYVTFLPWDSDYFHIPTYKINFILYTHSDLNILSKAVLSFKHTFLTSEKRYCFAEIPTEDILLLQAFTNSGFKLIENRLHYYLDQIRAYNCERFSVRKATEDDIQNLRRVAAYTRNIYDRVHADPFFDTQTADQYLAFYIEQAIKGFADIVLMPNEINVSPDAFIAITYLQKDSKILNRQLSRIMLTAVDPSCKGWHYKLVSEAIFQVKSIGAEYILMTTQSTNRAVIRNCEKLGFRLGAITHILSDYKNTD